MTGHSSSPLAAAVGLVAYTADGVRRLPRVLGQARQAAQRRYDEWALHGRDVLAGRYGPGPGGWSPTGSPETVEPPATERLARSATAPPAASPTGSPETVEPPATEPPAPAPPIGLAEPVRLPEDVQEEVAQLTPGDELAHAELPLPDFDHQSVPQLRGRLRTLSLAQLVQLRDYEQAHGARLPVLTLLDHRIAKLLAEPGP